MKAIFHIPEEQVTQIRAQADANGKLEPTFAVQVTDDEGNVVAEVEKLLYVRKKDPAHSDPPKR